MAKERNLSTKQFQDKCLTEFDYIKSDIKYLKTKVESTWENTKDIAVLQQQAKDFDRFKYLILGSFISGMISLGVAIFNISH